MELSVASRVAHDMGNLLTVILNGVGLVRETDDLPEDVLDELEAVERATRSAVALVGRLRLLSQIEGPPVDAVDLRELVRQAGVPAAVTVQLPAAPVPVRATATGISTIVSELVANALEVTDTGRPVVLGVGTDAGWATICVTDGGAGAQPASTAAGRGLGLAIVNAVTSALGGMFLPVGGTGPTTATVRLPLAADVPLTALHESTEAPVLIVDDDSDVRRLLQRLLERQGLACVSAADGAQALKVADEHPPRLILLDMQMPGMNGSEVLRQLRARPSTRSTPVILVTARGGIDDKVESLSLGADDYITKPFEAAELVARVQGALRRSTALRDVSPLTGLPGNSTILEEMSTRLSRRQPFACLYLDLDGFKAFNDHYGFLRGDEMIKILANALTSELDAVTDGFAGHIGGDDFIALCPTEEAERIADTVIATFDAKGKALYEPEDRARGYVELVDRQGLRYQQQLAAVSIGIVSSTSRPFESAAEMADVATEMKSVAKKTPGSAWATERRQEP